MHEEKIEPGFQVFLEDGGEECGAVRDVHRNELIVYIENAGDFAIPVEAIRAAHSEKVILDPAKLDPATLDAILRAHSAEDPNAERE